LSKNLPICEENVKEKDNHANSNTLSCELLQYASTRKVVDHFMVLDIYRDDIVGQKKSGSRYSGISQLQITWVNPIFVLSPACSFLLPGGVGKDTQLKPNVFVLAIVVSTSLTPSHLHFNAFFSVRLLTHSYIPTSPEITSLFHSSRQNSENERPRGVRTCTPSVSVRRPENTKIDTDF